MKKKLRRDSHGQFTRTRKVWNLHRWGEGYIDNRGYFRVYRPDFPKVWDASGYAKRSHVVWWLKTGRIVSRAHVLHHKNENKLDDKIENLELKTKGEHTEHHNQRYRVAMRCQNCGITFYIPRHRLKEGRGRFCTFDCYVKRNVTQVHRKRISEGLKRAYTEGRR
jgi:hypothetical protein